MITPEDQIKISKLPIKSLSISYSSKNGWNFHILDKDGKHWDIKLLEEFIDWMNNPKRTSW